MKNFFKNNENKLFNIPNIILAMISVVMMFLGMCIIVHWFDIVDDMTEYINMTGGDIMYVDTLVPIIRCFSVGAVGIAILCTVVLIIRNLKVKDISKVLTHTIVQYVTACLIDFMLVVFYILIIM
ncbi:MAG: hypothetical protein K2I96_19800 [Lachnospiraceae bacterium]|nr:hypothetical protein [Lachnospiraceae bacterium]